MINKEIREVSVIEHGCVGVVDLSLWIEDELLLFRVELSTEEGIILGFYGGNERKTVSIIRDRSGCEHISKTLVCLEGIWTYTPGMMVISYF